MVEPKVIFGLCPRCVAHSTLSLLGAPTMPAFRGAEGSDSPSGSEAAGLPLAAAFGDAIPGEQWPQRFGDYDLLGEIARGGMGVVCRARQRSLNRLVAVKLLLFGRFAGAAFIRRFRAEAEAAAALQHPHIVAVHEVGEHEGQHFFSMDLVEGGNLADLVREHPLPPRRAAALVRDIAGAVDYAHCRGVLHRDLKPSNVLLDTDGRPRITDFGLAKRVEASADLTMPGQRLGSPGYLPPEQADPARGPFTAAGDVYSLGALLYHLLTGRPPFSAETPELTLSQVLDCDPAPPRLLNPTVPVDLQTICLKCLEKLPARRYPTARALEEDLRRFLDNRPVTARPVSRAERIWRWARRRPWQATALALALVTLGTVAVVSAVAARRVAVAGRLAEVSRQAAESANVRLRESNLRLDTSVTRLELQLAEEHFAREEVSLALARLAALLRRAPTQQVAAARLFSALLHRDYPLPLPSPPWSPGRVRLTAFSPDGTRLLVQRQTLLGRVPESEVTLWQCEGGHPLGSALRHDGPVGSVVWSPDGARVATGSEDCTARLWDGRGGGPLTPPLRHESAVFRVAFSPGDGRYLLTVSVAGRARLWDTATGMHLAEWETGPGLVRCEGFGRDSRLVLTARADGRVQQWQVREDHAHVTVVPAGEVNTGLPLFRAVFSPDGRRLLTVHPDHAARLWNAVTGAAIGAPLQHAGPLTAARFSSDGRHVVTASEDHFARLWSSEDGRPAAPPFPHTDVVTDAHLSPDGQWLITGSWDNVGLLWRVSDATPATGPMRFTERVDCVEFSPDGRRAVTGSEDGFVQLWDLQPGRARELIVRHAAAVNHAVFSRDGDLFATASDDRTARVWATADGRPLTPPLEHEAPVRAVALSPDGRRLAGATASGRVDLWALPEGRRVATLRHRDRVDSVSFDATGRRVVTASRDCTAQVWSADTGEPLGPPLAHQGWVVHAQFAPGDRWLATSGHDHRAVLWDAATGRPVHTLPHRDNVHHVAFSPEGNRLATASMDNAAQVWDCESGQRTTPSLRHPRGVYDISWNGAGTRLVTAAWDRTARVWDAATGQPVSEPMNHGDHVWCVAFSPEGARVLTASLDGTARVWDAVTGWPITEPLRHAGKVVSAAFHPLGTLVLTASADGTARVWYVPPVKEQAPAWLADLAEALGGLKLEPANQPVFAGRQALSRLATLPESGASGLFERFRIWFFHRGTGRAAHP